MCVCVCVCACVYLYIYIYMYIYVYILHTYVRYACDYSVFDHLSDRIQELKKDNVDVSVFFVCVFNY